jgi:NADPH2:quinone reductase
MSEVPMQAIRFHEYGGPEVMRLEEVPTPTPGEGEALVRIAASGVNPSEVTRRSGKGQPVSFPAIPGIEAAGVVEAVGPGVTSVKKGDWVVVRQPASSYAEYLAVPASLLYPAPEGLTLTEASTLAIAYTTAWHALVVRGGAKAGDAVLVQAAASGVGIAAIQLAKALGCTVLGTSSSAEKLAWAAGYGMDHGINYAEADFAEEATRLTGGKGVDVIVDGVAGDGIAKGLNALAKGGRIAVFGGAGGREVTFAVTDLYRGHQAVLGAGGAGTSREDFQTILDWFSQGKLKPTIDRTWPLAQAVEAHRYQESRQIKGKTALVVSGEA